MRKIIDLKDIPNRIKNENLEVGIVSYGGSASNTLSHFLEKNFIRTRTHIWHEILCHCPEPLPLILNADIPFIYIYRDIEDAFQSQKKRGKGFWDTNQYKLSNNIDVKCSDQNLKYLMLKQYTKWVNASLQYPNKILLLEFNEFFTEKGHEKIKSFLHNKNLKHFPIYESNM